MLDTDKPLGAFDKRDELAEFILSNYFKKWSEYRQTYFEPKWIRNLAHFRCEEAGVSGKSIDWDNFDRNAPSTENNWTSKAFVGITRTKTMAGISLVTDNLLQDGSLPFSLQYTATERVQNRHAEDEELEAERDSLVSMEATIRGQHEQTESSAALCDIAASAALYGDAIARFDVSSGAPGLLPISNWDVVRDYAATDIKSGNGIIQRHFLSTPDVVDWYEDQSDVIDADLLRDAIASNSNEPGTSAMSTNDRIETVDTSLNELLECFVTVPTHLAAFDTDMEEDILEWSEVVVYILNEEVIGVMPNDSADRPFYLVPWQKGIDSVLNISVPDNVEDMQVVINNAFRGFEDNKYLSGNVWGFYQPDMIEDENSEQLFNTPGVFHKLADTVDDASKAVQQVVIADVGQTYLSLVELADRFCDEHSMIPKIATGATSGGGAKTAYETSQEIDKAGKYISAVIRNFDQYLITPFIQDSYDFNIEIGAPAFLPDLEIKAQGYNTYNDRIIRAAKYDKFMNLVLTNEQITAEFSLKRAAAQFGSFIGVDITELLLTAEEKAANAEAAQANQKLDEENKIRMIEQLQTEMELKDAQIEKLKTESSVALRDQALKEREFAHDVATGGSNGGSPSKTSKPASKG